MRIGDRRKRERKESDRKQCTGGRHIEQSEKERARSFNFQNETICKVDYSDYTNAVCLCVHFVRETSIQMEMEMEKKS